MIRQKTHRDGWATATEPALVTSPPREKHLSPAEKKREADVLRAAVTAHIAAGGTYLVLAAPVSAPVKA
ncbi:hypothetical protein AB8E26_06665 [Stenotrophomonas rhizophila]|uniref:hypothetical protein n=1 Tax=Stenotrophomonas rhizophila TaxID=216778 RepID=UPI0035172D40